MQFQKIKSDYKRVKWYYGKEIEIPIDWSITTLGDSSNRLENGLTYTHDKNEKKGVPITRIETISFETIDDSKVGYIETPSKNEIEKYSMNIGDILFSHINSFEHVGKTAMYLGTPKLLLHGMNLIRISVNSDKIISNYLIQLLKFHPTRERFRAICNAAINQVSINATQLKKFKLIIPPLKEQQKIASVLSNVDSLISQTQNEIEQIQRLKKGLMQKLLTRGIGHIKFKKVKNFFNNVVEIPDTWNYPKFSEVVRVNPPTKIDEKQVPYLPMDAIDVEKPHFNYFEERKLDDFSSLPKFQEHDVLFASITPSTENGKTCIVENFSRKGIGSSELTVLRSSDKVVPKYLYYYVKSHRIRQFAISQMMGTTGRQRVPDYVFKKDLNFELPSYPEQQKIASILSNVDSQIQKQQEYKSKIESLKKGLMQKLLTGQIRVKT